MYYRVLTSFWPLFFLVPPTFVESPKNLTIPKGHTASFLCAALGDPRPSITWYKSHDLITSNARYHILANQTLVIYSVTAQDSGSLTCRAMNEAGTREAKAYLLVAGLVFIFLYVIIFIPVFIKFHAPWRFPSYCNNRNKWGQPHYIMSTVLHPPPSSQRQKNYWNVLRYCTTDFPVFTTLPSNASVEEGHTVTLTCRAKGPDTPQITWLRDDASGIPINIVASVDTQLDPRGDLKYTDAKSKHRGMHICKACNTAGCKMAKAFLDILCKWITSLLSFSVFGNDGRRRKCREKVSGKEIFFSFLGAFFPLFSTN